MINTIHNIAQPVFNKATFEATANYIPSLNWIKKSSTRTNALIELYEISNPMSAWPLILHLIEQFKFVDEELFDQSKHKIAEKVVQWINNSDKTFLVALADEKEADGSQALLQLLKNAEPFDSLNDSQFINSFTGGIASAHEVLRKNKKTNVNLIMIDDFIGTGMTINSKLESLNKSLNELQIQNKVRVYLCALACMNDAMLKVNALKASGLLNDFYCPIMLAKGISNHFDGSALDQNIKLMNQLELKLANRIKKTGVKDPLKLTRYSFGFGKSEALYSWGDNNIPNNVFPIFWWALDENKRKRRTMFRRI